ncbi:MAG: AAA family ATPase [Erysipelotrichaceae bacterium]|nr:AAA family ATPase [Erysipelotrichaceae bacterium]
MQTNDQMKTLTKIRLINWHYFTDETIDVRGSVLFSGENASGKSTILDAIQLVLTTNSTRFNPAANERSKRKLNGYVRCKTGEEGNTYIRNSGAVISYVALEFYEQSKNNYFVIGVKLDSPDVESDITKKWFTVEGPMDSLSFIVNGKPAMDKEFTQNGRRIQFETQVSRAKDNFKVRLGRLDDNFEEMIIKSMAFRPMDKVKDFINNFILPKNVIRTEVLQENIRNLKELQNLINEVKKQIAQLQAILSKADEIEQKNYDIQVIDILIKIARLEDLKQKAEALVQKISSDQTILENNKKKQETLEESLNSAHSKQEEVKLALQSSETGRMIDKLKESVRILRSDLSKAESEVNAFKTHLSHFSVALDSISADKRSLNILRSLNYTTEEKSNELENIKSILSDAKREAYNNVFQLSERKNELNRQASELETRVGELKKNRFVYDENTNALLKAINEEYTSRRIDSKARVFADLLEIELPEWQDAVEGYLNTQRFNIIVDPEYYDIASEVYDRLRKKIHTVGLVNTGKLMNEENSDVSGTLAECVSSENRFARAYADYLLRRVVRCDSVRELKNHSIAITKTCMKYQGHVLSKISESVYRNPFIGKSALQIQLQNAEKELSDVRCKLAGISEEKKKNDFVINCIEQCNFDRAASLITCQEEMHDIKQRLAKEERDLKDAENNPTFIDLKQKLTAVEGAIETLQNEIKAVIKSTATKEDEIVRNQNDLKDNEESLRNAQSEIDSIAGSAHRAYTDATARYQENTRTKDSQTIIDNYMPRRQTLVNQRARINDSLIELQARYKDGDFGTGLEVISNYRDDLNKLERSDLVSYEDKLATIQRDCEIEFRENFLAKLRENIERAEIIFSRLNRSLKGIYYGEDSYKFELSANKQKQSLYDMITSDVNVAGENLFSSFFEEKYHEEMEDLFAKLTDEDLSDAKTIDELTDYRSYLDYDIHVISKEGRIQKFSKTYAEKSGGETQTPYYVAIAASFAQMYSGRETARIIMLDEAFNNMDEDRIASMMQFLKSQNFQVILAAPPARMEIIGEYVDSIYLTIRHGNTSVVEEYFYEEL